MVPAIVGLLLWPRRKKQKDKRFGKDIQSHRVSTASSSLLSSSSSSSSEENETAETPAKSSFKKCFSSRKQLSKSKEIKEEELQLVCYLCGQHFPRSRLLDHVPHCLKTWNRREEIKANDERAPLPIRPVELDQDLPDRPEAAEMFNKLMRCAWLAAINRRCEYCKKTFKTGAYIRHIKICQIEHRDHSDLAERRASDVVSRKPQRTSRERRRSQDDSRRQLQQRSEDPARLLKRAEALRTAPVFGTESLLDQSPRRFSVYHTIDLPQREEMASLASSKTLNRVKRNVESVTRAERSSRSFTGNRPVTSDPVNKDQLPKYKPYSSSYEDRHGRRPALPSRASERLQGRSRASAKTVTLLKEACVHEIRSDKPETHKSDPSRREVFRSLEKSVETLGSRQDRTRRTLKQSQSSTRATVVVSMHSSAPTDTPPASKAKEMAALREKENASSLVTKSTSATRKYMRRWSISEVEPSKDDPADHREGKRSLDKSMSLATRGPRGYTCYLCGRQFGSASLGIHVRQCRQLWEDQEALKRRKRDRRPVPTPPPELDLPLPIDREAIDEFNNKMLDIYEKRSLMPCPHCGRTFTEEAFEKHQRVCTASNPGGPLGPSKYHHPVTISMNATSSNKPKESMASDMRPAQYCCYLCGRQYGSQSLFLHVPRCQKLWIDREATKAKKERRSLPLPPLQYAGFPHITLPTDPEAILEFNNAVYAYWDRVSLYVCDKCGRSFNEESYAKHRHLCQGKAPSSQTSRSKKLLSKNDPRYSSESSDNDASKALSTDKHSLCHLCGENFDTKSLLIHAPHCEKRWLSEEEHKPREQRKSLPPRPKQQFVQHLSIGAERIAASDDAATSS